MISEEYEFSSLLVVGAKSSSANENAPAKPKHLSFSKLIVSWPHAKLLDSRARAYAPGVAQLTRYPGEMPHPVKRRRSLAFYIL